MKKNTFSEGVYILLGRGRLKTNKQSMSHGNKYNEYNKAGHRQEYVILYKGIREASIVR